LTARNPLFLSITQNQATRLMLFRGGSHCIAVATATSLAISLSLRDVMRATVQMRCEGFFSQVLFLHIIRFEKMELRIFSQSSQTPQTLSSYAQKAP
jgi:ABC-type amino acid transport system permease subunit